MNHWKLLMASGLLLWVVAGLPVPASAQQIILDKPVEAGELILFPDLNAPEKTFYYVPDKVRLATDKEGRPQFSFLRYVENVKTGAREEAAREGDGGGIVHAVVQLDVTDEQKQEALRALRRLYPDAVIEGPVVYKSGRFSLVSSFKEENGEFTSRVLGLGVAPILEGQKAAISMKLTKLGSKVLWESFKTAAPDISFSFEMEIEGFRLPKRAKIVADFDKIYEHDGFRAGIATPYLAAEINLAFDELRQSGAIVVDQIGEDQQLNSLVQTAYNKLTEIMFQPINGTGTPSLSNLGATGGNQPSLMDRASQMVTNQQRANASGNQPARQQPATQRPTTQQPATQQPATQQPATQQPATQQPATQQPATQQPATQQPATQQPATQQPATQQPATQQPATQQPATQQPATQQPATQQPTTQQPATQQPAAQQSQSRGSGTNIAIVATYEMKRQKQSGSFRMDLNKWYTDRLTTRFDENIGNLSRYMNDPLHFRQVNLDDPLFRQREVVAFIDGSNAADFGQYINFVTVHLRKKHEKGALTEEEVRIDRYNFNDKGNYFKMVYGWKDDNNRDKWMEYEYEVLWSLFGDYAVQQDFQKTTFNAINLKPPYDRRFIEVTADPTMLEDAGVRLITTNLYYKLGEQEYQKQVSLNPARNELSRTAEIVLPENVFAYEYEVTWRLKGNKVVSSGRQTSSESILFVDELPEGN